jgi:hypothetical protein
MFDRVLAAVLRDKSAEQELGRSAIDRIAKVLASEQVVDECNFSLEKDALFRAHLDCNFSVMQTNFVDALNDIEVTSNSIDQHLQFANYYIKVAKLMLKYEKASTVRSQHAVRDVLQTLKGFTYDHTGVVEGTTFGQSFLLMQKDFFIIAGVLATVATWVLAVSHRANVENMYLINQHVGQ